MYLFKKMLDYDISPTIVTCTNLARANVMASLEQIQRVRAVMKEYGIRSDAVFAESYVHALIQGRRLISAAKLADLPECEGRFQRSSERAARDPGQQRRVDRTMSKSPKGCEASGLVKPSMCLLGDDNNYVLPAQEHGKNQQP